MGSGLSKLLLQSTYPVSMWGLDEIEPPASDTQPIHLSDPWCVGHHLGARGSLGMALVLQELPVLWEREVAKK